MALTGKLGVAGSQLGNVFLGGRIFTFTLLAGRYDAMDELLLARWAQEELEERYYYDAVMGGLDPSGEIIQPPFAGVLKRKEEWRDVIPHDEEEEDVNVHTYFSAMGDGWFQEPGLSAEEVTLDKWYARWREVAGHYEEEPAPILPVGEIDPQYVALVEATSVDKWYTPLSQPIFTLDPVVFIPGVDGPVEPSLIPEDPVLGDGGPFVDPRLLATAVEPLDPVHWMPFSFEDPFILQQPEAVPPQAPALDTLLERVLVDLEQLVDDGVGQVDPDVLLTAETITADKWYSELSQPLVIEEELLRLKLEEIDPQYVALVEATSVDKYFTELPLPVPDVEPFNIEAMDPESGQTLIESLFALALAVRLRRPMLTGGLWTGGFAK